MPWKDWLADIAAWILIGVVVLMGTVARVVSEVREGDRKRFLSKRLIWEVPGVIVLVFVTSGISSYMELGQSATAAIGIILGWVGPNIITDVVEAGIIRIRGRR